MYPAIPIYILNVVGFTSRYRRYPPVNQHIAIEDGPFMVFYVLPIKICIQTISILVYQRLNHHLSVILCKRAMFHVVSHTILTQ